jgi:membrane protein
MATGGDCNPRGMWAALKATVSKWVEHKDARAGAAIAYYSLFSIGPLIVVAMTVAALVFDRRAVQSEVDASLSNLVGSEGAAGVARLLGGAGTKSQGMFAEIIGIATLLYASIGVVMQFKDAMNTIWEVEPSPRSGRSGTWDFVRTYVVSLAAVLAVGFLLLISMLLTAALSGIGRYVGDLVPVALLQIAGSTVSFGIVCALFITMFKWLPDAEVAWRDVWLGGVGAAALFEIGRFLISFYIGKEGLESKFGGAASIVVVLIWVYYAAQILLFGAEFTHVRYQQRCSGARQGGV